MSEQVKQELKRREEIAKNIKIRPYSEVKEHLDRRAEETAKEAVRELVELFNPADRIYSIEELRTLLSPVFMSYPVNKAVLFGSYARGDADNGSDLDIVVDSGGAVRGFKFFRLLDDIVETVNKRVDLIDAREVRDDSPVRLSLQKEGVLLYEHT